jgi:hypothetical protein
LADPSGQCSWCIGALAGGLLSAGYYAFTAPTDIGWGDFAAGVAWAAAYGAFTGALLSVSPNAALLWIGATGVASENDLWKLGLAAAARGSCRPSTTSARSPSPSPGRAAADARAARSGVPLARAIEQGLVKPGGKLAQVLGAIEGEFYAAPPKSAIDALGVIVRATEQVGLDPGIASVEEGGEIVLQNKGGVTTTLGPNGSILVRRGSDVLLHLLPPQPPQ